MEYMENIEEGKGFLDFAYQLYKTMKTNQISLVYEGEVTQEITKTFTKKKEKNQKEQKKIMLKYYLVAATECLKTKVLFDLNITGYGFGSRARLKI